MKSHLFLIIQCIIVYSFNIPGFSDKQYIQKDKMEVLVSEVKSLETQLPYKYSDFDFCYATEKYDQDESIAEALLGESKEVSALEFEFKRDILCEQICKKSYDEDKISEFVWLVDRSYKYDIILDNIPAIVQLEVGQAFEELEGIPIGFYDEKNDFYIYNHFDFFVTYYQDSQQKYRIAGFQVIPSAWGTTKDKKSFCEAYVDDEMQKQDLRNLYYTYSVQFIQDNTKSITSRWDKYRNQADKENHEGTLFNSFTVNVALAILIYFILRRILMKDLSTYEQLPHKDDSDDMGWKQLKSDVFRPPGNPIVLSTFVGVGLQLGTIIMCSVIFIAAQYFFEKYRTQSFLNVIIVFYIISGFISGYYCARIYKMMGGCYWLRSTILTAVLFPGTISFIYFIIEFAMVLEESLYKIRFKTIFQLFFFWFLVQIPLVFLGSVLGYKRQKISQICRVNPVPMPIPQQYFFLSRHMLCVIGGLLPFGCILFELQFVVKSIWNNQFYYLFGFLLLAFLLLIITCAEISILLTYVQLNNGNHKWWWNSFYSTGFCGVYVFAYCMFYWLFYLNITRLSSTIMYFGTMAIGSIAMFLFCGAVGFVSSYLFIRYIYSQIKAD